MSWGVVGLAVMGEGNGDRGVEVAVAAAVVLDLFVDFPNRECVNNTKA